MRWLGMMAAVATLTAVVLNIFWFQRFAGISPGALLRISIPTVLLLFLFLGAVFFFGRLSARLMLRAHADDEGEETTDSPSEREPDKPHPTP